MKGIVEAGQEYDEAGNLISETCCEGNGNRILMADCWSEHRTEYNEAKQKISERWLGTEGIRSSSKKPTWNMNMMPPASARSAIARKTGRSTGRSEKREKVRACVITGMKSCTAGDK